MSEKLEIELPKALKIELFEFNILLAPLEVVMPQRSVITLDKDVINPNTGMRFDFDKGKKYEGQVNNLYTESLEHPFQAIVVATGAKAVERGIVVGDLVYTDSQLHRSRRVVKYNGYIYTMIGVDSILGKVCNFVLETEELKSVYI